jgi:parallel beta-helix repeat protein
VFGVSSPLDDAHHGGTLRWAVAHARDGDTIQFTPAVQGAPIVLTLGGLGLNHNVTIESMHDVPQTISVGGAWGGVFVVAPGAQVTLRDLTITGGNSGEGVGGAVDNYGTLTMCGCTASDNGAEGIFNHVGGTATISNCTVSGDTEVGIDCGGTMMTVSDCTVSGNAEGIANGGPLTVSGCTVSDNGYGIANVGGPLTVSGCTVSGNGYGITNNYEQLTVVGCTVSDNNQGGIDNGSFNIDDQATATVSNCVVSGNSFRSGVINDGTMTVSDCTISGNTAHGGGGGINNSGVLSVSDCTISGNSADGGGGAISNDGVLSVSGCMISGNTSRSNGGGIYSDSGALTVTDCTITGNSGQNGGGIYISVFGSRMTLSGDELSDNSASVQGGAIYNAETAAALTVLDSIFSSNSPDNIYGFYTDGGGNTFS